MSSKLIVSRGITALLEQKRKLGLPDFNDRMARFVAERWNGGVAINPIPPDHFIRFDLIPPSEANASMAVVVEACGNMLYLLVQRPEEWGSEDVKEFCKELETATKGYCFPDIEVEERVLLPDMDPAVGSHILTPEEFIALQARMREFGHVLMTVGEYEHELEHEVRATQVFEAVRDKL